MIPVTLWLYNDCAYWYSLNIILWYCYLLWYNDIIIILMYWSCDMTVISDSDLLKKLICDIILPILFSNDIIVQYDWREKLLFCSIRGRDYSVILVLLMCILAKAVFLLFWRSIEWYYYYYYVVCDHC